MLALLFAFALLTEAPPAGSAPSAPSAGELLSSIPCTEFRWHPSAGVPHGSLFVPVMLNGRRYWFQLDTGSDGTVLYGSEAKTRRWVSGDKSWLAARQLRLGGVDVGPADIFILKNMPAGSGTIGLDILLNRFVVIDFPGQRFCVAARPGFSQKIKERVHWTHAALRRGKFFIETQIGNKTSTGLFLDTGSSAFPIVVERARWQELTGRTGPSDAETRIVGTQWGKTKAWPGAHSRLPISIAGFELRTPMIYYEQDGFYKSTWDAEGLVGNAPFESSIIVLDLGPSMRFGILQ